MSSVQAGTISTVMLCPGEIRDSKVNGCLMESRFKAHLCTDDVTQS